MGSPTLSEFECYRALSKPMAEESDGDLVRRIANGRARDAEQELCRRFAPRVRAYGLRHLRDEQRALDLVQSVLLVVLEASRAGRIDDPDRVERFVLGTCRNMASRARSIDARARPTEPEELDVASFLPDLEAVDVGALVRCMAKLDERARTVVYLSFHQEAAAEAIATQLSTTAGNVRVLRHRALAQLRTCIDGGATA